MQKVLDIGSRASIYSVYFENRFRFFSIPTLTNPSPNPISEQLTTFSYEMILGTIENIIINYANSSFQEIILK